MRARWQYPVQPCLLVLVTGRGERSTGELLCIQAEGGFWGELWPIGNAPGTDSDLDTL